MANQTYRPKYAAGEPEATQALCRSPVCQLAERWVVVVQSKPERIRVVRCLKCGITTTQFWSWGAWQP